MICTLKAKKLDLDCHLTRLNASFRVQWPTRIRQISTSTLTSSLTWSSLKTKIWKWICTTLPHSLLKPNRTLLTTLITIQWRTSWSTSSKKDWKMSPSTCSDRTKKENMRLNLKNFLELSTREYKFHLMSLANRMEPFQNQELTVPFLSTLQNSNLKMARLITSHSSKTSKLLITCSQTMPRAKFQDQVHRWKVV